MGTHFPGSDQRTADPIVINGRKIAVRSGIDSPPSLREQAGLDPIADADLAYPVWILGMLRDMSMTYRHSIICGESIQLW